MTARSTSSARSAPAGDDSGGGNAWRQMEIPASSVDSTNIDSPYLNCRGERDLAWP